MGMEASIALMAKAKISVPILLLKCKLKYASVEIWEARGRLRSGGRGVP
jgi:hypothetical protein